MLLIISQGLQLILVKMAFFCFWFLSSKTILDAAPSIMGVHLSVGSEMGLTRNADMVKCTRLLREPVVRLHQSFIVI